MSDKISPENSTHSHQLQCMEIWNGNHSVENIVSSQGIEGWIFSRPYQKDSHGGDVHYLSLCVGGIVTRILLADVAGHGDLVASTSTALRQLLRRFMNAKRQDRLVAELNREFTRNESDGRFATAIVATFLSHKNRLLLTNAGHPRPLRFSRSNAEWTYLDDSLLFDASLDGNLPLGITDDSSYQHYDLSIQPGDWLLLYTDALTEAFNDRDEQLGESGLLQIVKKLDVTEGPSFLGSKLLSEIRKYSEDLGCDDTTLIALKFIGNRRRPGFIEKLQGYSKLLLGS